MVDTLLFFLSKISSKSLWRIHFFFVFLSSKSKHLQFKTNQKMNYHKNHGNLKRCWGLIFCSLSILLGACTTKVVKQQDYLPIEDSTNIEVNTTVLPLPDTLYPSAERVRYDVEIKDSSDLTLSSLESLYDGEDVLTFRKTLLRDANFGGKVTGTPATIDTAWVFHTYYNTEQTKYGIWGGGSGWTGQPLYHKKRNEIMVGSLCGRVYFIDYNTGKATRQTIDVTNTIKGTPSLDPTLDNLYVGQGVPNHQPFGSLTIDLKKNQITDFFGRDPKARRGWNAFDSSPVVVGDFLFWPGENGCLYKFRRAQGKLTLAAALRYTINGSAPGVENSLCVYRNYGFFGDNHGNILAVNLNTMKPVWSYNNHDDIDGSIVCKVENDTPYIYCGCEVDKQGNEGICHIVKLDGRNGNRIWNLQIPCKRFTLGEKELDGGMYCTPLLGMGDCSHLLFANICRNGADGKGAESGEMIAVDIQTGKIVHSTQLNQFAWSSPVGFLNEKNEMYIFTGDSGGTTYLIRAKTGEILCKKHFAHNFESSPLVIGNTAIVGSRQNGIYKFVIK